MDLLAGEHRSPAYRRINPNGKVPVLQDRDFTLWESHAIIVYLADVTPGQTLYPREPQARADVNRWLFWSAYHFTPAVGTISREKVSKPMVSAGGKPDAAEVARGEQAFREAAAILDAHLAQREWITDSLTLADLSIAAPLMHVEAAQLPWASFEHIQLWFARIQALPAWHAATEVRPPDQPSHRSRAPTPA